MASTYKADGDRIDYTPVGAVSAGDIILLAGRLFLATEDIGAGVLGSLQAAGIIEIPKNDAEAVAVGDTIYWESEDEEVTTTSGDHTTSLGASLFAAAETATTIKFRMT